MPARSHLVAVLALAASACGPTNMLGRTVRVEERTFEVAGARAPYFVGVPDPDTSATALPVVVFVEGDGGTCQAWSPPLWRRFLVRFTGNYRLVRPQTFVNRACGTPAFARADFDHRVDELEALLRRVRDDEPGRAVYLLGHSAGAHVAILAASRGSVDVAGLVDLAGGIHPLSDVLRELAADAGRDERDQLERALVDIRAHPRDARPFWGRSYAFWWQMAFSDVHARWLAWTAPLLVAHGLDDDESVPASLVVRASRELAAAGRRNATIRFYEGEGHDLLNERVLRDVAQWIDGAERARRVAAADARDRSGRMQAVRARQELPLRAAPLERSRAAATSRDGPRRDEQQSGR